MKVQSHITEMHPAMPSESDRYWELKRQELTNVFRFREEWDSLKVASFSINLNSFLRYVATQVTFLIVVLQIEYEVTRTMNALAAIKETH